MADNQNNFNIDLEVQVKQLKELEAAVKTLRDENKLSNTNGNTLNSLLNSIHKMVLEINRAIKDGSIGPNGIKNIATGWENIHKIMSIIASTEKDAGQTMDDYNKKVDEAKQNYDNLLSTIKDFKKQQKDLKINAEGNTSKKDEKVLMEESATSYREGKKGRPSKAEDLLKTAKNLDEIKKLAEDGDEVAIKALKIYTKYIDDLKIEYESLNAKIAEYIELANAAKAILNDTKDQSGFSPEAVQQMEEGANAASKYSEELNRTSEEMKEHGILEIDTGAKVKQTTNDFARAGKQLVSYALIYRTFKKMLKEAIKTVVQMDEALTTLTIVTGKSRQEVQELIPELRNLSLNTSSTMTDVANLTAEYVRQGRTIKDSITLAEQTAKAAKIAGISTSDSLNYMTAAINGFNLAAKDAQHVSDVFAKLSANAAVDYEKLAISLSKVSAQANTAGMSIEYTTALLAKGIETTQEAPESIGTALKTIVARMREITDYGDSLDTSSSINSVESALKAVGISLRDTSGQFRDLESIFNELGPKWEGLNTMQQQAIAQAVAGTRQQARFLAIMQDWDRTLELVSDSTDAAGASQYQYSRAAESMQSALTNLTTAWQGLVQIFANNDIIVTATNAVSNLLSGITQFLERFGDFPSVVLLVSTAFLGIKTVLDKIHVKHEQSLAIMNDIHAIATAQNKEEDQKISAYEQQIRLLNQQRDIASETTKNYQVQSKVAKENLKLQKQSFSYKKNDYKTQQKTFNTVLKQSSLTKKEQKELKSIVKQKGTILRLSMNDNLTEGERNALKQQYNLLEQQELELTTKSSIVGKAAQEMEMAEFGMVDAKVAARAQELMLQNQNLTLAEATKIAEKEQLVYAKGKKAIEEGSVTTHTILTALKAGETELAWEEVKALAAQKAAELKKLALSVAGVIVKIAGAIITNPVGAVAALGVLAAAGFGIGMSISNNSASKAADNVKESQDTIYENKQKVNKAEDLKNEYSDIMKRKNLGTATGEDYERMVEIEDELVELDDRLTGTGQTLIDKIDELIDTTKEGNDKLIEENFKNLSKTKDKLSNSEYSLAIQQEASRRAQLGTYEVVDKDGSIQNKSYNDLTASQKTEVLNTANNIASAIDPEKLKAIQTGNYYKLSDEDLDAYGVEYYKYTDDYGREQRGIKNSGGWFGSRNKKKAAAIEEKAMQDIGTISASMGTKTNLVSQLEAYKEAMEDAAISSLAKTALKSAYSSLNTLMSSYDQITLLKEYGIDEGTVSNVAQSFLDAGMSAEGVSKALQEYANEIKAATDAGKSVKEASWEAASKLYQEYVDNANNDDYWRDKFGKDENGNSYWDQMSDTERSAAIEKTKSGVLKSTYGYDLSGVSDQVTSFNKIRNNIDDIISTTQSGAKLTQEQIDNLMDSELQYMMADENFVKALYENPTKAAIMLKDAQDNLAESKKAEMTSLIDTYNADLQAAEHRLAVAQEGTDEYYKAAAAVESLKGQIAQARYEVSLLGEEFDNTDELQHSINRNAAYLSKAQKDLEKTGQGTAEQYAAINTLLEESASLTKQQLGDAWSEVADAIGHPEKTIEDYYDIVDGKLIPNTEKMSSLTKGQREYLEQWVETGQEYYDTLGDIGKRQEENAKAMRDQMLTVQEEAVNVMKSRLEAEYNATSESLDKRKSLYEKYFAAISEEANEEDYENDRQALLNKIAKLSTATDSTSLAALKEAQQALNSLDSEYNQTQREIREQAAYDNIDKTKETLDDAYNNAMKDVQGLWEEFCEMQAEDQEALFKQYGESFQTVTDLQRQIAEEEYATYAASLASLVGSVVSFNGNSYALNGASSVAATGSSTNVTTNATTASGDTTQQNSSSSSTTNNSTNTSIGTIIINTNDPSAFFQKMASDYGVNLNTK